MIEEILRHPLRPRRHRAYPRVIKRYGPDSMLSRMAATLYGSSETLFYVLAVYFGAVGVKRTRHAIPAALVGDIVAAFVAAAICTWMFR